MPNDGLYVKNRFGQFFIDTAVVRGSRKRKEFISQIGIFLVENGKVVHEPEDRKFPRRICGDTNLF